MSNADIRGRFIWHELMTTDPDAAGEFYSKVVPWKTQPSGMPGYTLWMSGKSRAGGLMSMPAEAAGSPPHWIIYVGTPDTDSTVADAERLGGRVLKRPADIPHVGRFAVLADPQGAAFAVFTPTPGAEETPAAGGPGEFGWHELATTGPDAALRFYTELFGWSKGAAHNMGAEGTYQLISHGGKDVGGLYKVRDASTPPGWTSYVRVADAAKAANAAKAAGGRVVNGPIEVPGGSWIAMLLDPQGGAFAVLEPPQQAAAKPAAATDVARKAGSKAATAVEPPGTSAKQGQAGPTPSKPKPATPPAAAAPASRPASAAAARQSSVKERTVKPSPSRAGSTTGRSKGKKSAARKAPARKSAVKRGAKRKAAGKGGSRRRVAGAKRVRGAKRAAMKSSRAKRGRPSGKRTARAGRRPAARSSRGKSRKHR